MWLGRAVGNFSMLFVNDYLEFYWMEIVHIYEIKLVYKLKSNMSVNPNLVGGGG